MPGKRRPDAEPQKQLGVRIDLGLYKRVGHHAIEQGLRLKDVVSTALEEYLKKRGD